MRHVDWHYHKMHYKKFMACILLKVHVHFVNMNISNTQQKKKVIEDDMYLGSFLRRRHLRRIKRHLPNQYGVGFWPTNYKFLHNSLYNGLVWFACKL